MGSLNRQFDFDWVDAFSQEPFCGNGCAVVYDGGILSEQSCLNIVKETSLVESALLFLRLILQTFESAIFYLTGKSHLQVTQQSRQQCH